MDMQRGWIYSAVLHVGVALLVIFGLPHFMDEKLIADQTMIVEMVQIAEKTNPPPSKELREEPPKPVPPKPVENKPPPPQARPIPPPPPVPEPPKPQVAETPPEPLPKPPEPKPPEVKPEPKPEVKKEPPPPPKETATPPPPPPQIAKVPPPKKPPPKRDDFLSQVLKDVAPTPRASEKTEPKVAQKDTAPQRPPAPPSLDQQVSISEIDAVKRQIEACWSMPAGARDARDLIVTIRATVAPDGRVISARIDDMSRMGDPFYRAAAESAQRAVLNPRCQPLKLPPHKYEQWKDLRLDFNPKDMIG
jgi:hypothetical protein